MALENTVKALEALLSEFKNFSDNESIYHPDGSEIKIKDIEKLLGELKKWG